MAQKKKKKLHTSKAPSGRGATTTAERPPPPPSRHQPSPQRRAPRRPSTGTGLDARLVSGGVVALVALVFLLAAGPGAGILVAGIVAASMYVVHTIRKVAAGERLLVAAQKAVVLTLLFLMPVVIDPRTADVFATVKFSILATGGVALVVLLVVDVAMRWGEHRISTVHWLVGFLVVWGVVTTLAGGHTKLSILGFYSSNNGLAALVSLALVFAASARTFRTRDIGPVVSMLWLATTGVVVLYGVLQLLDQAFPGRGLEPVNWPEGVGVRVFGTTGVWSTFGNPNHFGGFCAITLPLGIAVLVGARSLVQRIVAAAIAAGALVVLGQTSSRGAWVAAAVAIALMALLGWRMAVETVRRQKWIVPAGLAVAAGSVAASLNTGLLSKGTATLFETGGSTTIAQRVEFWKTTVRMAGSEPLLGFGMDGYRLTWPHFMSLRFVRTWGYDLQVTGPHNTFMAHLYWGGWPALAALVGVVVLVAIAFARSFRALRRAAASEATLAGLASIAVMAVGYLLVESFNVERVELAVLFWFAAGLIVAVRREAVVPETIDGEAAHARPRRRAPRRSSADVAAVAGAAALTVILLWLTTAPWRADNKLRSAGLASRAAQSLTSANPEAAALRSQSSRRDIDGAISTNPWEARYLRVRADGMRNSAQSLADQEDRAADMRTALERASADYRQARRLVPHDATLVGSHAEVLYRLADATGDESFARQATTMLAREVRYGPRNGRLRAFLGLQRIAHGEREAGVRDLDAAVAMFPRDTNVLSYAVNGYQGAAEPEKAKALSERLARLKGDG